MARLPARIKRRNRTKSAIVEANNPWGRLATSVIVHWPDLARRIVSRI
jgi:hypothetical protein